jgi:CheY-like chemotaxis protein
MSELSTVKKNQNDRRILVAEDNAINQKLIQQILEKAGYGVDLVDNGRQAVEFACQIQYDMIFMDIQMPIMDGYAATRRIRKLECGMRKCDGKDSDSNSTFPIPNSEFKKVPIIALTGNDLEAVREKSLSLGMNDCIGKPLFRDQLLALVQHWTSTKPDLPAVKTVPKKDGRQPPAKNSIAKHPIDLDKALSEFMGDKQVLDSLLIEFTDKVRSQINAIQQAFLSLEFKEIAQEAHSIKGGAANLTANKVAGVASALEKAAGLKQADLARQLANELEEKLMELETYLQTENISVHGV